MQRPRPLRYGAGMSDRAPSSAWGHMSGAAGVVDSLRRAGVTRAFGVPVLENAFLVDAFQQGRVELVLATCEAAAASMADAHARVSGRLGACLLGPGPGLAKALAGVAQARMDSTPLLVLVAAGRLRPGEQRRRREPRYDHLALARPVCKRAIVIDAPEMVPSAMARAVQLARRGEPGPVLVEIPPEVQRGSARMEGTGFRTMPQALSAEAERALTAALELIQRAERVGLIAGAGSFQATEELQQLAEMLAAPVATSLSGLGALPDIHPLNTGFGPGPAGSPVAAAAFGDCDLLLAVGCKFSEAATGAYSLELEAPLVHIDREPGVAGLYLPTAVAVTAPARQALRYLLDRCQPRLRPELRERIRGAKRQLRERLDGRAPWPDAVDPIKVFRALRELLATDDVLVLDAGRHAYFGFAGYPVQAPRSLIAPVDYRATGFSLPAAVAAALERPDGRVVACVGEGGFIQSHQELLTARRCNVAPLVLLFADQHLAPVRGPQQRVIGRETAVDLIPVDYEALSASLAVGYRCIRRDAELAEGLREALCTEAPVVVELRVDYREPARLLQALQHDGADPTGRGSLRQGLRQVFRRLLGRGDD